jgi:hypothetical protein
MPLRSSLHLAILLLALLSNAAAQGYVDVLPDHVRKPFQIRYDAISKAVTVPVTIEWAGSYYRDLGATWGESIIWEPKLGFAAFRDTCSNGPRAWVNYGETTYRDGVLTLSPERESTAEFVLDLPSKEFMPIKWGEQHWLVPTAKLALFAYAINAHSGEEHEVAYLKSDDREKRQTSRPALPSQYQKLLGLRPINASIVEAGQSTDPYWKIPVTINAGKNKGVIEGMSFWLVGHKEIEVQVMVNEVREQTSLMRIVSEGRSGHYEKDIVPSVGWRFTSRMPSTFNRW